MITAVFIIGVLATLGGFAAGLQALFAIQSAPALTVIAWASVATMAFVFALLCLVTTEFAQVHETLKQQTEKPKREVKMSVDGQPYEFVEGVGPKATLKLHPDADFRAHHFTADGLENFKKRIGV